ncbi:MAG: TonB-dependent receptor [Hyphomicrobium sp.]|jgi:hemoglobin/transferrin/lactoferrin receptor protein
MLVGASALALAVADKAMAQEAQLPPLVVEGNKPAPKKKSAAKKAPAAAAVSVSPTPVASKEAAQSAPVDPADVPYTVPAGVSVVGAGEIETFGQGRVDSVLRTVPGTFTRESASNPGIAVNIRGFEGQGRVGMSIDGVRQNFRFTGHEAGGFAYVDPLLLAGIDIQRGAVSTVGGAGALAGTANFRTIDVQDIIKPGANEGALTSLSWGSNGIGWAEMGAAAMRSGGVSVMGALSHHDESNYKNGNDQTVPFTGEDLWSGLVKVHFDIASDERLSFQAMRYNNAFVANSYDQKLTSDIYKAGYILRPADNPLVDFSANVAISNVEMQYGSYFSGSAPSIENAEGRVIEDRGISFDLSNTSRFMLGSVRVASNYGLEYYYDDVTTSSGGVNPNGRSDLGSGFTQTTFSYGMWDLIGGLRYQNYNLEGTTTLGSNNPFGMPAGTYNLDNSESSWDPKVTLAARLTDWLQPYVTYSQSMRAPTVSESLMTATHPYFPPYYVLEFVPNPFLVPEKQKGWEFGFNVMKDGVFAPRDKLRIKADYYTQDVENYITSCIVETFPAVPPGSQRDYAYFCNNFGTTKVQGVEVEGDYDAGYAFAHAAYTYTHSNIPQQQNGLGAESYMPDHVFSMTGGLRFLNEKLVVGARGTYVSQTNLGSGNVEEAYTLADVFSTYEVRDGFNLGVTVENVFDRAYTPTLSTVPTGSTAGLDTGRGRTFILSTRAQF